MMGRGEGMIDLVQSLNELIGKLQRMPEGGDWIKWKNIEEKFVKQVRTLDSAIRQKQKEYEQIRKLKEKKYVEDEDANEMTSLIEPEYTGEGGKLKQRAKPSSQAETFEEFMQKRSKKVEEILKSMEKINQLYNDLNALALDQDEKFERLEENIEQAYVSSKDAKKELKKAKPHSLINPRLLITALILSIVVYFFIYHYFYFPYSKNNKE